MKPPATAHELREAFLRFFEERGHRRIPSAPIVPPGDPTLLFTSAGMVQFKPFFTGQAEPPSRRMVSVQKCFRTSDIESVGNTQHHTFFEMLGNFSIGDYFKAEAVPWAWEFVTQHLKLPPDRLWPAVYEDDDEAYDLWIAQGVPAERIMRYGEEENYWFSGDVGPCGPDSEIHYDFGEQFGCGPKCEPSHGHARFLEIWNLVFMTYYCDGQKRDPLPQKNIDTGSGFERVMTVLLHNSKGWDKNRLPSPYDTEVFQPIIRRIEELSGKKYGAEEPTDRAMRIVAEHSRAVTCLVGDERTPVVPSNEERGYVCRRMLRRAVYFGRESLGIVDPFIASVSDVVIQTMAESYPELSRQHKFISDTIDAEELRFRQTLETGRAIVVEHLLPTRTKWIGSVNELMRALSELADEPDPSTRDKTRDLLHPFLGQLRKDSPHPSFSLKVIQAAQHSLSTPVLRLLDEDKAKPWNDYPDLIAALVQELQNNVVAISGEELFLLHDTYGFPIDLTKDIAKQHGFTVDEAGFEAEMARQRERARASAGAAEHVAAETFYANLVPEASLFTGYQETESATEVVALVVRGEGVPTPSGPSEEAEVVAGQDVEVFLTATPFYPEGGGQVGDRGEITGPNGRVEVTDTQRVAERLIVHRGRVAEGRVAVGDAVTARVDPQHRANVMRNHTATHLLHAALRQVLGSHVRQAGSLVAPDHLRFDFTHNETLTPEQLAEVESLVNEKVRQDVPVHTRETTFDEAMSDGVLAFFGDKYGERVRVVEVPAKGASASGGNTVVPRFSAELCGGTHCERTGEIGAIIVTSESSIGSGMRRLEAVTGPPADAYTRELKTTVDELVRLLGSQRSSVIQKLAATIEENDALRKKVEKMERAMATGPKEDLLARATDVDGVRVLATRVEAPSMDALRFVGDSVRKSLASGVAVLGSAVEDPDGRRRPMFIAIVSKDLVARGVHAGNLLRKVAEMTGGSGGGRPDMAQGGGKDAAKLDEALAIVPDAVRDMLAAK